MPSGSANYEGSTKIVGVERIILDMSNGHNLSFGSRIAFPNEEFALIQVKKLTRAGLIDCKELLQGNQVSFLAFEKKKNIIRIEEMAGVLGSFERGNMILFLTRFWMLRLRISSARMKR